MSLRNFAGFDLFPTAMHNSVFPVTGGGFVNTPLYLALGPVTGNNSQVAIGVSPLPGDCMGTGNELRRSLVACKTTQATVAASVAIGTPGTFNPTNGNGDYRKSIWGFTFKDNSPAISSIALPIVYATRTTSGSPTINYYTLFGLSATGTFTFHNVTTVIPCELGREYGIEITMEWNVPTSTSGFSVRLEVWIDGEYAGGTSLMSVPGTSNPNTQLSRVDLGLPVTNASDNRVRRLCFADIYHILATQTSDAPYNDRIGPQKVLLALPKTATANAGWETTGADTPVEALTYTAGSPTPASYVTTPTDDGSLEIEMDYPVGPNSTVYGVQGFVVAQRDQALPRNLQVALVTEDDRTIRGLTVTPSAEPGGLLGFHSNFIGAQPLAFEDLQPATLTKTRIKLSSPTA